MTEQIILPERFPQIAVEKLLSISHSLAGPWFSQVDWPWQILPMINAIILQLGPTLPSNEYEQVDEQIWIARDARVAASASLTGPLIIGHDTELRHCAFIRGNALVGDGVIVGNSTELKNCILFDRVQVPHYNYVGDSVLGFGAHMGAGAITSNVKSDHSDVSMRINDVRIPTGLRKFGALLGDQAEVGCNSVLNPGSVLGCRCQIYPLSMVRGYVPEDTIYKQNNQIVLRHSPLTD